MSGEGPRYAALDWDGHWHFFIPTPTAIKAWADGDPLPPLKERYLHLRFPKLWEVGAMASIAERGVERFIKGQPKEFAGDVARILQNVFNLSWMPQAIAPLYEQATNRLQFFDRPIETQAMQERQPFARSNEYTSKTVKAIGEATRNLPPSLQISPARLEALLRGYLGTWATYGLGLSDAAFFDNAADIRADQYPVLHRFYEQTPTRHSRYVTELYDLIKESTETRQTLRWLVKSYREDEAQDMRGPENSLYGPMTHANKGMQTFTKQMDWVSGTNDLGQLQRRVIDYATTAKDPAFAAKVRNGKDWNDLGSLKRYMLDRLIEDRNDFARRVVTRADAQKKAAMAR